MKELCLNICETICYQIWILKNCQRILVKKSQNIFNISCIKMYGFLNISDNTWKAELFDITNTRKYSHLVITKVSKSISLNTILILHTSTLKLDILKLTSQFQKHENISLQKATSIFDLINDKTCPNSDPRQGMRTPCRYLIPPLVHLYSRSVFSQLPILYSFHFSNNF